MGVKVTVVVAAEMLLFAALLFGGAGTFEWPAGWAYLAIFLAGGLWATIVLLRSDPALLAERMKSPIQMGQPVWDRVFIVFLLAGWCAWVVLMGMDAVRFRWSRVPVWVQCAGAVLIVYSYALIVRVMRENTFLSAVVRIQVERGQHVISTGPYAVVRHPLYAAVLLYIPANALMLGSWWGLAGSVALCGGFVFRTAMEDRKLHRELPGYPEYAARVRYRLIPGVW